MDQRSWIKYQGSRILDLGPCSGMNDHPGRDTDVRSRPSESTIKDLSFYIGFIKIQSSNKHVGPCFGTNGHSRRDPDMISRLPDTTSHFLSVFIGFRCSNRVKIVILVESMNFYRKKLKKTSKKFRTNFEKPWVTGTVGDRCSSLRRYRHHSCQCCHCSHRQRRGNLCATLSP